jgi:malto-oligosyltrehalose synthase
MVEGRHDEINWRRFFDVNDLVALQADDERIFEATHAVLLRLFAEGLVDGFRVDHIDGLSDPPGYCRLLRSRLEELWRASSRGGHPYLIVEKILGPGEMLPVDWGCDGTTGYDFMDQVSRVLHDPAGAQPLAELWGSISGRPMDFACEEEASRRETLDRSFSAQLESVVAAVHRVMRAEPATREIGRPAVRRALIELLVHMRVYRSYAVVRKEPGCHIIDSALRRAAKAAMRTCMRADRTFVDRVARWLAGDPTVAEPREAQEAAMRRFQQLGASLAAKAVEDTAFYRCGRLLSRIDVGFDPMRFAASAETFHGETLDRQRQFPNAMLTTATHDHKRGEDVRARLAVLSSVAGEWLVNIHDWLARAARLFAMVDGEAAPSCADVAILLQTMVGAWPPDLSLDNASGCATFRDRLGAWQLKAIREAKLTTDWMVPNEAYEVAARAFLMRVFATPDLIGDIARFANRIMPAGAVNGLVQTLLKLTSPGVPDVYQGTEFWDYSLVDPDNRRPVDFAVRMGSILGCRSVADLARRWRDGRVKQTVIRRALAVRRASPQLFAEGDYVPIAINGRAAGHVLAFARRHLGEVALTIVSRLPSALLGDDDSIVIPSPAWADTKLVLPRELCGRSFCDAISRAGFSAGACLSVADILHRLPIALLVSRASMNE